MTTQKDRRPEYVVDNGVGDTRTQFAPRLRGSKLGSAPTHSGLRSDESVIELSSEPGYQAGLAIRPTSLRECATMGLIVRVFGENASQNHRNAAAPPLYLNEPIASNKKSRKGLKTAPGQVTIRSLFNTDLGVAMDDISRQRIELINDRVTVSKDRMDILGNELRRVNALLIESQPRLTTLEQFHGSVRSWSTTIALVCLALFGITLAQLPSYIQEQVKKNIPILDEIEKQKEAAKAAAVAATSASGRITKLAQELSNESTLALIQQLKDRAITIDKVSVIFHSEDLTAADAMARANTSDGATWFTYRFKTTHTEFRHDVAQDRLKGREFGKEVLGAWFVPLTSPVTTKWRTMMVYPTDTNKLLIAGDADKDAGIVQGHVYVVYRDPEAILDVKLPIKDVSK